MMHIIDDLQSRLFEMIESLRTNHTVCPAEGVGHISDLAKINVLWYLDSLVSAVAGARLHLGRAEAYDTLWDIDKTEARARMAKRLVQELGALKSAVSHHDYCRQHHCIVLETVDLEFAGEDIASRDTAFMKARRQYVTETLGELRLIDQALEPWREELRGCIEEPVE